MKKVIIILVLLALGSGIWFYQSNKDQQQNINNTSDYDGPSSLALKRVPADTLFFAGSLNKYPLADYMKAAPLASDTSWLSDDFSQDSLEGERLLVGLLQSYMAATEQPSQLFDKWGLAKSFDSAFYSVGLLPVFTFSLDDITKYRTAFEQLKTEQRVTGIKEVIEGVEVESYLLDTDSESGNQVYLLHSIKDGYATLTFSMTNLDQGYKRLAIGVDKPQQSLADSGYLVQMANKYGFEPLALGYVNHVEIINGITGQQQNNFATMLTALMASTNQMQELSSIQTPACKTELAQLASNWPATVFGADKIDTSNQQVVVDSRIIVESNDAVIMSALRKLRGFIPQQLVDRSNVFSMALGLDIQQVAPSLMAMWSHMTATPAECTVLKDIQSDIAQNNPAMAAMAAGFVQGFKGLSVSIQDMTFKLDETTELQEIEQVDALITLSADDVQMLYNNAAAAQPNLSQMQFPQDGETVAFPLPIPTSVQLDSKLSRFGNHLGLSTGSQSIAKMNSLQGVPLSNNGFIAFSMNYAKYFALLNSAMSMMPMDPEQKQLFEQLQNMDLIVDGHIDFTEQGIEIKAGYGPQ